MSDEILSWAAKVQKNNDIRKYLRYFGRKSKKNRLLVVEAQT